MDGWMIRVGWRLARDGLVEEGRRRREAEARDEVGWMRWLHSELAWVGRTAQAEVK